jgi:hypothetical protein
MVHLRNANFRELERELQERFSEHLRRVWVQYSNNKSRVTLCITLFPHGFGRYRMVFAREVLDFSVEAVAEHVSRELVRMGVDSRGRLAGEVFGF